MKNTLILALTALVLASNVALAAEAMTKEQAIDKALAAHPGEVTKAYQETKRGQQVWEVKINADDGSQWEVYYTVAGGELLMEEQDDD